AVLRPALAGPEAPAQVPLGGGGLAALHPFRGPGLAGHAGRAPARSREELGARGIRAPLDAAPRHGRRRRRVGRLRALAPARQLPGADRRPRSRGFVEVRAAMSYEPSHSTEHLPPPEAQADEHVAGFKIVAVGVIALAVFGGATWWSSRILDRTARTLSPSGPLPVGKEIGKAEIGIVDQTPFETTRGAERYRREQLKRLNGNGGGQTTK